MVHAWRMHGAAEVFSHSSWMAVLRTLSRSRSYQHCLIYMPYHAAHDQSLPLSATIDHSMIHTMFYFLTVIAALMLRARCQSVTTSTSTSLTWCVGVLRMLRMLT